MAGARLAYAELDALRAEYRFDAAQPATSSTTSRSCATGWASAQATPIAHYLHASARRRRGRRRRRPGRLPVPADKAHPGVPHPPLDAPATASSPCPASSRSTAGTGRPSSGAAPRWRSDPLARHWATSTSPPALSIGQTGRPRPIVAVGALRVKCGGGRHGARRCVSGDGLPIHGLGLTVRAMRWSLLWDIHFRRRPSRERRLTESARGLKNAER